MSYIHGYALVSGLPQFCLYKLPCIVFLQWKLIPPIGVLSGGGNYGHLSGGGASWGRSNIAATPPVSMIRCRNNGSSTYAVLHVRSDVSNHKNVNTRRRLVWYTQGMSIELYASIICMIAAIYGSLRAYRTSDTLLAITSFLCAVASIMLLL